MWERYPATLDWLARTDVEVLNRIHDMHAYERLEMALHDGDVLRTMACGIAGLSVAADSLSAIKHTTVRPVRDGTVQTVEDVLARIGRYTRILRATGGGVTVSGGEPLFQHRFTRRILEGCRRLGGHTAIDTSGYLGGVVDDAFLDDVDLVLLDVESGDEAVSADVTGRALRPTLDCTPGDTPPPSPPLQERVPEQFRARGLTVH